MRNIKKVLFLSAILASIQSAQAFESSYNKQNLEKSLSLSVFIGNASIDIDSSYAFDNEAVSENSLATGIEFGYQISESFRVDLGYLKASDFDLLNLADSYNIIQTNLQVAYEIPVAKKLIISPKIGLSFWDLDANEGQLFNPGVEENKTNSGTDLTYGFELAVPLGDSFSIIGSLEKTDFDFGELTSTEFGVVFHF